MLESTSPADPHKPAPGVPSLPRAQGLGENHPDPNVLQTFASVKQYILSRELTASSGARQCEFILDYTPHEGAWPAKYKRQESDVAAPTLPKRISRLENLRRQQALGENHPDPRFRLLFRAFKNHPD
jgi:hypothetical protein